ncbi:MAG: hypothetical protein EOM80_00705 [Erysipelotrichia bacterium]|nr:hypothetical protein [Erysipelotrichia bacterium]
MSPKKTEDNKSAALLVIETIRGYLDADNIKYQQISEDALELYMQGNNLTMHLVIYLHNSHLIFRVPGFLRNVDVRRMDLLLFIMQVTNEILDIRFEISKDGKSLSACCQHILEDGSLTRKQFDLAMMVLMHIVDDTYPRFMQIIYGSNEQPAEGTSVEPTEHKCQTDQPDPEEADEVDDFAPVADEEVIRKIN